MFYSLIELLLAAKALRRRPPSFERLNPLAFRAQGIKLAGALRGKVVCVYTDTPHSDLGYIWKIRINETAKSLAFLNIIPEMNHNELVGFVDAPAKTAAILLKGDLSPRMQKRFTVTTSLLQAEGVKTVEVALKGASRLEQTWRTLMLSDWTAYFLAKASGVNPAETKIINTLKARMKK